MPSVASGYLDLEKGILFRSGTSQRKTSKRQPPVKLPSRLIAHLTRWKAMDGNIRPVVHYNGSSVQSVKKAFRSARIAAGLDDKVVPHCLRHSCATWLMQSGIDTWEAAGYLGMTAEVLERVYGHHSPKFQQNAAEAISNRRA
jgi:integrase